MEVVEAVESLRLHSRRVSQGNRRAMVLRVRIMGRLSPSERASLLARAAAPLIFEARCRHESPSRHGPLPQDAPDRRHADRSVPKAATRLSSTADRSAGADTDRSLTPSAPEPADPLARLFERLRADASDDDIRHASRAMLDPVIASYPFAQGYRLLIFYDERPILRVDADRIYRALNELPAGTPHRGRRAR